MGRVPCDAQRQGKLDEELDRLGRIPLLICDQVGYIPFDPQAASLMFMLVSRRYEPASLVVTSNKPFSAWGEIFGDDMAAVAMVDRRIHHAATSAAGISLRWPTARSAKSRRASTLKWPGFQPARTPAGSNLNRRYRVNSQPALTSLLRARREPRSKILAGLRQALVFPGWLPRPTACENRQVLVRDEVLLTEGTPEPLEVSPKA